MTDMAAAIDALAKEVRLMRRELKAAKIQPEPEYLPISDYARRVRRSKRTVLAWVNKGKVVSKREGEVLMIKLAEGE